MLAPMYRKPDRAPLPVETDQRPGGARPTAASAAVLLAGVIAVGLVVGAVVRRRRA